LFIFSTTILTLIGELFGHTKVPKRSFKCSCLTIIELDLR